MLLIQATCPAGEHLEEALEQASVLAKQLRVNIQVNFYANSVVIGPTCTPEEVRLGMQKFRDLYPSINFNAGANNG